MKRFFLRLVCLGAILAVLVGYAFSSAGSYAQTASPPNAGPFSSGEFNSIIVDFSEQPQALSQLPASLSLLSDTFNLTPALNSAFSEADNVYTVPGNRSVLESLRNSALASRTEFIEPNYIYRQDGFTVNDPGYAKQWNLKAIKVEGAWSEGINGKGVTVAVIDTGISQGPDLKQTAFVPGYDFVNNRTNAADDNGHGTHVAGTIAQSTNNNYGVAGVAYGAKLMPLKVLSRGGSGTVADIAEAIRFAADNGADVINMSLGGGGESLLMREAIGYAHGKGVVIVTSAGNSARSSASYPALYNHVIGVSATGPDGKKASYSNYGKGVDIAAPGGETRLGQGAGILQETINPRTVGEFQFKYFQGTSMAAPHVAGVAALVKSKVGTMSPDQVWEILKKSAEPVEGDPRNFFGAGYLNAQKAVAIASPIGFSWPKIAWKDIAIKLIAAGLITAILAPSSPRFSPWKLSFLLGISLGSIGLFPLKAVHLPIVPSWVFQLLGTSIPELGSVLFASNQLNPLFVSMLLPLGLMTLLISHGYLRWVALGISIGMIAFMLVAAFTSPVIWLIGTGIAAKAYLLANVLMGAVLTRLFFNVAIDKY